MWIFISDKINKIDGDDKVVFGEQDNKVAGYDKLRFSSDIDLPLGVLIRFHTLVIIVACVI